MLALAGLMEHAMIYRNMTQIVICGVKKPISPGKPRYDTLGYSFEDYGFVASGVYQDSRIEIEYLTDLRRYEPTSDSWTKIRTDYKSKGRVQMIAEIINNKIIIGLKSDDISHGRYERYGDI